MILEGRIGLLTLSPIGYLASMIGKLILTTPTLHIHSVCATILKNR